MDLFDLSGRVALVTGGSRGLGREMALAFARFGADVMIASRKQDACDATADEIRRATGRRALGRACHVGRWNELEGLVDAAYEHFGQLDVLVNNAGMSPLYPSVEAVSEELWDKVLGVNLKGPFRLTALIGSRMAQGNGGSIINISSGAASRPTPDSERDRPCSPPSLVYTPSLARTPLAASLSAAPQSEESFGVLPFVARIAFAPACLSVRLAFLRRLRARFAELVAA